MTAAATDFTAPAGAHPDASEAVVAAIVGHHAQLADQVAAGATLVADAVERLTSFVGPRDALVGLFATEVLPHAAAEEQTLYPAGAALPRTQLLVSSMVAEHRLLEGLVRRLEAARTPVQAVGASTALRTLFEAHLAKENGVLLPALVDADVDLAGLLGGMHEILGEGTGAADPSQGCGCGGCGCGVEEAELPADRAERADLDVRPLPPALRHERIFAAVAQLGRGESFVLANDHDPKPLRYQLEAEQPGEIGWDYLAEGPDIWRVLISRL